MSAASGAMLSDVNERTVSRIMSAVSPRPKSRLRKSFGNMPILPIVSPIIGGQMAGRKRRSAPVAHEGGEVGELVVKSARGGVEFLRQPVDLRGASIVGLGVDGLDQRPPCPSASHRRIHEQ